MVTDNEIIEMLHRGMKKLLADCDAYEQKVLTVNLTNPRFREFRDLGLDIIRQCKSQLIIHMNLEDTQLVDINFYQAFKTLFMNGSYRKGVEFYIKEIINDEEGDTIFVEDEETLNKEFTIHYCMPCMYLVPHQLASNAKKYSLSCQNVEILLVKDTQYSTNTIYVSNVGPHCTDDEINRLVEDGVSGSDVRGKNAKDVAGMGIGLSEIKEIIGLHETILDTSFDISTDNKIIATVEDMDYSIFTTIFSYSTNPSPLSRVQFPKTFKNRIPIILLHNSVDIIATLIEATKSIKKIRFKGNDSLVRMTQMFLIEIEKFQDLTKLCLYVRNHFSVDNLLGNICNINISDNLKTLVKYICLNDYPALIENSTVEIYGQTGTYEFYSCLYPCLYGFLDNILYQIDPQSKFVIEIDEGQFTMTCEDIDFRDIIVRDVPDDWREDGDYELVRRKMYYDLFLANEIDITIINPNKLQFVFLNN